MAKRYGDEATDYIWIVVTVNKQSTSVRMLLREVKTKNLAPNEYCYKFKITTDFKKWDDRTQTFELPQANPPEAPGVLMQSLVIGKSITEKVTEVLDRSL